MLTPSTSSYIGDIFAIHACSFFSCIFIVADANFVLFKNRKLLL